MSERKEKFTPGPWRFRDKTYGKYRFLTLVNDASPMVIIANMPSLHDIPLREWKNAYDIDEVAANAALIASAPEMYALLDRLSHALFAEDADEWAYEIKSLLAKARGEAETCKG